MSTRAQIKMTETILILFVFFLLLIVGAIFYSRYSESALRARLEEDVQARAIKTAQIVTSFSELQCSVLEVIKFNCFDRQKIETFSTLMADPNASLFYFDILGFANISVKSLYPTSKEWQLYDRPGNYTGWLTTQIPVAIYDPGSPTPYSFGWLQVAAYIQRRK